ncbi:hypothetical protein ACFSRY_18765 [Pontibacter locisalis]|uniref:Uncharacterized protein n=1 Tax=Pontibacter locisalis TaxID=1719035 RepID=A0ABW5IQJ0_9BACT
MAAVKAQLKHVVLAREFGIVREIEAKNFVRRIGQGCGFQNYW